MCFAPQRRALFRHLNFQKWSGAEVLCTFWLGNVLRATTACTFSTSQLPKVVRSWCVLCILTSKCASRHNGVQLFIHHLTTWLRTRRFSEPTFRPSGATSHWKNIVFRNFPTFSRTWIFVLLRLSLFDLLSSTLLFSSLLFSDSSCPCFSSVHIVGSLTSKLPSINIFQGTHSLGYDFWRWRWRRIATTDWWWPPAQYFRQVEWKYRKTHWYEAVSSALNFQFLKEVSQNLVLMLSTSKNEEFSQNCSVFDVVNFEKWGSLAEVFRFWCCQVQKLRKSRRIASISSLQIDRQIDRQTDREVDR